MSSLLLGANLPLVKRQNRSLVLRILLHHGPISRTEICEMTHLTPATISNVIGELQEGNLVVELGSVQRAEAPRLGRRRLLVDLNARGWFAVGVYLGIRSIQVGIGDLRGRVLGHFSVPSGGQHSLGAVLAVIREQMEALLDQTQIPRQRLCGVGLGSVGLVDSAGGVIVDLPQYGWRQVPIKAELEARLGLPVAVDNSRRAMATAEAWLGPRQELDSVLLVHVATTIGGAVVYQHDVLHGANYAAGQLGHLIVAEGGERCACGRHGCLDTVASGAAIVAQAARAAQEGRSPALLALTNGRPDGMLFHHVFAAAEQGDPVAQAIIARSADYVGRGVAHYVSLFDPEAVVLTGAVAILGGEEYRRRVSAVVEERAYRPSGSAVALLPSSFGGELEIVGPLSLALRQFVYSSESWTLGHDIHKARPRERLVIPA